MLGSLLKRVFGTSRDREVNRLSPLSTAVNDLEPTMAAMSTAELQSQTGLFKERLAQGETVDDLLPEAFATVREAAKRVVGMRPFDVQILGGIILHQGGIAEMMTGEGKTLVATMPLYLNGLTGRGIHLVTVNDYLARRDSEWMGPIFEFLGLTVGLIQQGMHPVERQVAYRADITYGTNNEFGFDYLRDNMAKLPEERVQRVLNFAIVDEVDSILIDEARTPLIISGMPEKSTDLYVKVDEVVRRLRKDTHYETEEKNKHVALTEEGMTMAETLMGVDNLYTDDQLGIVHSIEQSLRAHSFYKRDDEYMVKDNQVYIVDEFTGRIMEGRRWSDGLHQAVEAKERVPVQQESQTIASISYQNYFKLYETLAGMTGTAVTEAVEFAEVYKLRVVQIPTNLPMRREDKNDLIFASEKGKFNYVADEIEKIHETTRPILVGTVSIEKSEYVAKLLRDRGIEGVQVLNAKHHEREASIVASAGKPGAITIATNMAGRGTDIKLAEGVREAGGLAIIGTERHESRRIDNQLRGRCGRQGDPGSTRFYVSLEDEVARLFGGDRSKKLLAMFGGEQLDEMPLDQKIVSRSIERAQRQVEEMFYEGRKHVVKYDDVMNRQRKVIYQMRRDVLEDKDITEQLHDMFASLVGEAMDEFAPENVDAEDWDLDGLEAFMHMTFRFDPALEEEEGDSAKPLEDDLFDQVLEEYKRREALIAEELRVEFREYVKGDENLIDFDAIARKRVHDFEMMALLQSVDSKWIEHLYTMDYLKESVNIRALGQKDPLLEYKREGFELFDTMTLSIYQGVVQTLFRVTDPEVRQTRNMNIRKGTLTSDQDPFSQLAGYSYIGADKQQDRSFASYDTSQFSLAGQASGAQENQPQAKEAKAKTKQKTIKRVGKKVKANDPCPCGSGKKYKKCHGANQE